MLYVEKTGMDDTTCIDYSDALRTPTVETDEARAGKGISDRQSGGGMDWRPGPRRLLLGGRWACFPRGRAPLFSPCSSPDPVVQGQITECLAPAGDTHPALLLLWAPWRRLLQDYHDRPWFALLLDCSPAAKAALGPYKALSEEQLTTLFMHGALSPSERTRYLGEDDSPAPTPPPSVAPPIVAATPSSVAPSPPRSATPSSVTSATSSRPTTPVVAAPTTVSRPLPTPVNPTARARHGAGVVVLHPMGKPSIIGLPDPATRPPPVAPTPPARSTDSPSSSTTSLPPTTRVGPPSGVRAKSTAPADHQEGDLDLNGDPWFLPVGLTTTNVGPRGGLVEASGTRYLVPNLRRDHKNASYETVPHGRRSVRFTRKSACMVCPLFSDPSFIWAHVLRLFSARPAAKTPRQQLA